MAKKKLTLEDVLVPKEEIPYEVPENWCWVKLGGLVNEVKNGTTIKQNKDEIGPKVTRIESVQNNKIDFNRIGYITEEEKIKDSDWYEAGDIALSHINSIEHVGKTALIEEDYLPLVHGMNLLRIRLKKELINPKYFAIYTQGYDFKSEVVDRVNRAVNQVSLNQKRLNEIPIVVPPLAEQERIVNRVESLFDKVDKAAGLVDEARDGFEKRRAAILEKAFSGELTKKWREENGVSDEWETVKFKELGKLERGRSKHRPRNDERLFGGLYPFIQTGDIANSNGYIYHHKQTLSEFGLEQSRLFPKGTLCITIAANIGDVAILTYDCCFPDSVVGFTPNDDVESKFIYYYLNLIKRDLEHYAPATAQKNINLAILGSLDIPKPYTEEQRQIVEILEKSLDNESKVEDLIDLDDNIDLIKKSILAKAFRGELASNDLNEESSIELLREIVK